MNNSLPLGETTLVAIKNKLNDQNNNILSSDEATCNLILKDKNYLATNMV